MLLGGGVSGIPARAEIVVLQPDERGNRREREHHSEQNQNLGGGRPTSATVAGGGVGVGVADVVGRGQRGLNEQRRYYYKP